MALVSLRAAMDSHGSELRALFNSFLTIPQSEQRHLLCCPDQHSSNGGYRYKHRLGCSIGSFCGQDGEILDSCCGCHSAGAGGHFDARGLGRRRERTPGSIYAYWIRRR
jgi:hypothetical protein